jgi:hypothetical protein
MATSNNTHIQGMMDEVDAIDPNDESLEAKLQKIAEAVAAEQQKVRAALTGKTNTNMPVDPQDDFACEGCQ